VGIDWRIFRHLLSSPTRHPDVKMKTTFQRFLPVTLFSLLAAGIVLLPAADKPEKKMWADSYLGKKGPEFVVEKWLSKEPDRTGKFVLIDFWATWCGPCRKAIPELNKFHNKFGDKLVVVGVSDEKPEKVEAFTNPKIEYFSAVDTKSRMNNKLNVTGIPHVILMDPNGIVRWEGFPLLEGHELTETVVADILARHGKK